MPFVDFSDSDLLRNRIVPAAWYELDIGLVGNWSPSKDQQSNNLVMEATIVKDADTGDAENAGVPITIQFNDKPKARGFIEGFLRALGVEVTPGRYDLGAAQGQKIEAFIEPETYEGRTRNRCNHKYRQLRATVSA